MQRIDINRLVDNIFDGRLRLSVLIEKVKAIYNPDILDEDFWYVLFCKYIIHIHGSIDSKILEESLRVSGDNLITALFVYNSKVDAKVAKEKTFKQVVDGIRISINDSVGLVTVREFQKIPNPTFTTNELFDALYCKVNNIDESIYRILKEFVSSLDEFSNIKRSEESLMDELLQFYRKVDNAYENLAS